MDAHITYNSNNDISQTLSLEEVKFAFATLKKVLQKSINSFAHNF